MRTSTRIMIGATLLVILGQALVIALAPVKAEEFNVKNFLDNVYVSVGAGYKLTETQIEYKGVPYRDAITAYFDIHYKFKNVYDSNFTIEVGIQHVSNWAEGEPFNAREEYSKNEIYIKTYVSIGSLL